MERRVYFTPSPSEVGTLAQRLLFADRDDVQPITFFTRVAAETDDGIPGFEKHTLAPTEVCVTAEGFAIAGRLYDTARTLVKISVDTTVEPPVAVCDTLI